MHTFRDPYDLDAVDTSLAELLDEAPTCDLCRQFEPAPHDDYCAACRALMTRLDADEAVSCAAAVKIIEEELAARKERLRPLPVLEPITIKPVELDEKLWGEWRTNLPSTDTADEHY
jgi:hypothetical protein